MRWLRDNRAELHAYGGLVLASVGVGFLAGSAGWLAGLGSACLVAGAGAFYLAHRIPPPAEPKRQERPRAVA